jgi:two-component system sensor histidine kinase BarA
MWGKILSFWSIQRDDSVFGGIYARMMLTVIVPFLLFSFAALFYIWETQNAEIREVRNLLGDIAAENFVTHGGDALSTNNEERLQAEIVHMLATIGVDGLVVYDIARNRLSTHGFVDLDLSLLPIKKENQSFKEFEELIRPLSHPNHQLSNELQQYFFREVRKLSSVNSNQELVGWVLVAIQANFKMGRNEEKFFLILMVVFFLIFFSMSLSIVYARTLSISIGDLNSRVDDMTLGNVDDLAPEAGPNEVRFLAKGINTLATTIRDANLLTQNEIERATSQLQATLKELEEVAESQNQFLARMSHELRTPLTAVIGYSRMVARESSVEKRNDYLDVVEVSSKMLLTMIDDILDFSKAQSAGFTLEKINFNIRKWLLDIVSIHQQLADDKDLLLEYKIVGDLPQLVRGDPVRLAQVISNLLGNAIKFTEQGHVSLSIEMDLSSEGCNTLHCSVSDSGQGIETERKNSVFEPFSQENESINRLYGGAGLGLPICKKLVNQMGGEIDIDSIKGQGTIVSFTCQLYEPFGSDLVNLDEKSSPSMHEILTGVKVLVAEDNLFSQKLIVKLLEMYGAECSVVNNGLEAIEIVRMLHVDVVIMDVHMPVVDGVEACESIVNQSSDSPPVLGLTADVTGDSNDKMIRAGARVVLEKPINETVLINAILASLDDREKISHSNGEGILSSILPIAELKQALEKNLDEVERQLEDPKSADLKLVLHDLLGLSGLYGMAEFRQLILSFKASYSTQTIDENRYLLLKIRQHLNDDLMSHSELV